MFFQITLFALACLCVLIKSSKEYFRDIRGKFFVIVVCASSFLGILLEIVLTDSSFSIFRLYQYIGVTFFLIIFLVMNYKKKFLLLLLFGGVLNPLVTALNDGFMPVSTTMFKQYTSSDISKFTGYRFIDEDTKLPWLGDIFHIHGLTGVFSIGDTCVWIGLVVLFLRLLKLQLAQLSHEELGVIK